MLGTNGLDVGILGGTFSSRRLHPLVGLGVPGETSPLGGCRQEHLPVALVFRGRGQLFAAVGLPAAFNG